MKNVHPCTFFIDEFEAKPQTSLLYGTGGIRAAFAGEVLKIGHPCPILSFEFCLRKTLKALNTDILYS